MVRGTNKVIIEVNDTQNKYFEKAILFVKDCTPDSKNPANLNDEAKKYIEDIKCKNTFVKKGKFHKNDIVLIATSAGVGALITMIVMLL